MIKSVLISCRWNIFHEKFCLTSAKYEILIYKAALHCRLYVTDSLHCLLTVLLHPCCSAMLQLPCYCASPLGIYHAILKQYFCIMLRHTVSFLSIKCVHTLYLTNFFTSHCSLLHSQILFSLFLPIFLDFLYTSHTFKNTNISVLQVSLCKNLFT